MTRNEGESEWPQVGLERHISYVTNFLHLNINLGSPEACTKYFDSWSGKYRKLFRSMEDNDIEGWVVRMRQSLKSAFTSTHFALAAREAEQEGSFVTFYYLSYYAVFHAVWGVMYLHPNERMDAIARPTHNKLPNIFQSEFCGARGIIRYQIKQIMEDLRMRREYYSYRMPLNSPFDDVADARGATTSVSGIIKQCVQLANLHSHLVAEAAKREGRMLKLIPIERRQAFEGVFKMFNSQRHSAGTGWFVESADKAALDEFLTCGSSLQGHSVMFEHMSDQFMTYSGGGNADVAKSQQVKELVFSALF